jgi:uncharacterized protein (TIGR02996 family)
MTDSLDQLMAAVLQAPREDAPRLGLADWLIARDDPRGEFIRAQIERARLGPTAAEADRLARRERELLARHEAEWVGPLANGLLGWRFRRGFIEEVTLDAEFLLAHAEDLFAAAPIESLIVHEAGGVSEELAACPYLARVSRLHFGSEDGDGEPLGDEGLAALAGSPHLTQLAGLSFGMEQFDGDGLQALAAAPWVHRLRSLGLARNEIGEAALASFLAGASQKIWKSSTSSGPRPASMRSRSWRSRRPSARYAGSSLPTTKSAMPAWRCLQAQPGCRS